MDLILTFFILFILVVLVAVFRMKSRMSSDVNELFSKVIIVNEKMLLLSDLISKSERLLLDQLNGTSGRMENNFSDLKKSVEEQIDKVKATISSDMAKNRDELFNFNSKFSDSINASIHKNSKMQYDQISFLTKTSLDSFEKTRGLMDEKLNRIQEVVDEKLHSALEKKLGNSFNLINERLEMLHKGLGEMKNISSGMNDIKKIMGNVKTRGVWGEIQLENILEQILNSGQFEKNFAVRNVGAERVDFAIRLPDKNGGQIFLPIDAKFPVEDYTKIEEEKSEVKVEEALKQLDSRVKLEAKSISDKYINPPYTTDFAILFLPTEGLYYEVLRKKGLFEFLQNKYRVIVAGPWTLSAILNSLQLGFRTLAIEKRSNEVWEVLDGVRSEFGKFGLLLEKTQKKLNEASSAIDGASRKTKKITQQLDKMQLISEEKHER